MNIKYGVLKNMHRFNSCYLAGQTRVLCLKGTTINDLGVGPEEIEGKMFLKVHVREIKIFKRH